MITSTVAGITTLTVVINPGTDALTLVQQPTVEFVAGPPEPGACQLAAPNEPVPADGATAAPLELRVLDAHGNAVAGQRVEVSVTGTGNALEPNGAVTDGAGIARVALRSTVAEVKTATWALGRGEERAAVPGATAVRFRPGPVSAGSTVAAAPRRGRSPTARLGSS